MAQDNIRTKLGNLKKGTEITHNGYTIKKQGTNWIVKKGDFYNRSFTESQLGKLAEKLSSPIQEQVVQVVGRAARKAQKLAKQLEAKAVKEAKKIAKGEMPFKRNKFLLEGFNIIVQSFAYLTWLVYYFTDLAQQYLGENALYVAIGVGIFAILTHLAYVRQLGKKHRILNSLVGFINILLVASALTLFYGPLTHTAIEVDQILPSVKEAFTHIESIVLTGFVTFKWISTLLINKK